MIVYKIYITIITNEYFYKIYYFWANMYNKSYERLDS